MATYFDRYAKFRTNGMIKPLPGIKLISTNTDKQEMYRLGETRLDKLSNMYYNNPYSGWLIMLANPAFGGLEFNIPDSTVIRIPFPYDSAIKRYLTEVDNHKALYGE
jgi:hypothetical protein